METRLCLAVILAIMLRPPACDAADQDERLHSERPPTASERSFAEHLRADIRMALRPGELARLGAFLAVSGVLANTDADQQIREHWQEDFRGERSDDVMKGFEEIGNIAHPIASIPLFWFARSQAQRHGLPELYTWSDRSARAMILAFPQHVVLRHVLGSPRPPVGPSDWDPFEDRRGVSGHAVYGAIPFMTLARMEDRVERKAFWWALSTLPGLSRVHRDRHYLSQFVAGWGIAWQVTRVTRLVDEGFEPANVQVVPVEDGAMLVGSWRW